MLRFIGMFPFLIGACYFDIRDGRIPNRWNLCGLAAGMAYSIFLHGGQGFVRGIIGAAIPFGLLFGLFMLRCVGAGDIKLLCAVGTFLWTDVLWVMVCAFSVTACYGLFICGLRFVRRKPPAFTRIRMAVPILIGTGIWIAGGHAG